MHILVSSATVTATPPALRRTTTALQYAASKAGLEAASESCAAEVAGLGVTLGAFGTGFAGRARVVEAGEAGKAYRGWRG